MTVLAELARTVTALRPGQRVRVAIDGVGASGKSTLADSLADAVRPSRPVVRATVDRFHRPRPDRLRRGTLSAEGCCRDSCQDGTASGSVTTCAISQSCRR